MVKDAQEGTQTRKRLVVLVSGTGLLLQALLDACRDPAYPAHVVAVGADRHDTLAVERARSSGIETFVCPVRDHATREEWDAALTDAVASFSPDLVISAGFLKLVGPQFLERFSNSFVNTHPSLLPSFPGLHAPANALDHGVRVTGTTAFFVDGGVDTGPIIEQHAVLVEDDDTPESLHERIKATEQDMLVSLVDRMARRGWTIRGRKVTIP